MSYQLPRDIVNRAGISSARVFFQGRNLFLITAKGVNVDPETMQVSVLHGTSGGRSEAFASPQMRPEFYFGVQLSF